MKQYDAIIIGGGGGLKLRPITMLGKKVAIIEKEDLGGTCLNRGCIPSKMLIYPADFLTHIKEDLPHHFSKMSGEITSDFSALVTDLNKTVQADSAGIHANYEKNDTFDFYHGEAKFIENKIIEVNGEQITAEKIFVATGTRPSVPNIEGLEGTPYMTSRELLQKNELPKKMIVFGGGYIAVELGHAFGAFGTDVHFLVRSSMIKAEDKEIQKIFMDDFAKRYNVHFKVAPKKVEYKNEVFYVTCEDEDGKTFIMESDALFVATGVRPNSDDLGLENTDIVLDEKGFIQTNEYLETAVEGVYALGDVRGKHLFRHAVNYEGEYLLRTLYVEQVREPLDYGPMPHAIFTYPQIAGVGVTEQELQAEGKQEGVDYVIGTNEYKKSAYGMAMKPSIGLVKIIVNKKDRKIIGCHIIGADSATFLHMMIAYMKMNATIDHVVDTIFIHPAFPEIMRNAARKIMAKM
ncbi:dihydrolipoamide dehydrogenase [Candidatus Peregrinibacteria bacterium]|nr:MAG: dihydrolipoamide dehydrogenase [Candidatus Peregrinibacteria bacterium]